MVSSTRSLNFSLVVVGGSLSSAVTERKLGTMKRMRLVCLGGLVVEEVGADAVVGWFWAWGASGRGLAGVSGKEAVRLATDEDSLAWLRGEGVTGAGPAGGVAATAKGELAIRKKKTEGTKGGIFMRKGTLLGEAATQQMLFGLISGRESGKFLEGW